MLLFQIVRSYRISISTPSRRINGLLDLDLANRASELFKFADDGQRSKLLGFLLSSLQLNDKKLSFTVDYPMTSNRKAPEGAKSAIWCHLADVFKTISQEKKDDIHLLELAKMFNHNPSLV